MYLLDKPFTYEELRSVKDLMQGNIARVCVSDDIEDIVKNLGFAVDKLNMIAYSRIKNINYYLTKK